MLALLALAAAATAAEPDKGWEWRAAVGGEFDLRPNGVFDLGARKGDLVLELRTTMLVVSWEPSLPNGKAWLRAIVEPGTHGMFQEVWVDGVPRDDLNTLAIWSGVTGGAQAWLPNGFYLTLEGASAWVAFVGFPDGATPGPGRPWHVVDGVIGQYTPWAHWWVRPGIDVTDAGVVPHLDGRFDLTAPWIVRPVLSVQAGWAEGADALTATRLGGNNPYSVPLAGAAWAEFWVEDYAALRIGPEVGRTSGPHTWAVQLVSDLVVFDLHDAPDDALPRTEAGFSLGGRYDNRGRFVEAALGWAPWLPRPDSLAMTGWVRAGLTWGKGWGPR